MVILDPDKSKVFEFKINISGNSSAPIARLVIPFEENLDLSILGEIHNNSIQVVIPKLRPFYENLKSGTMKLEIIVDGNLFTPWVERVEFKESLKVVAEVVSEKEVTFKNNIQIGATLINERNFSSLRNSVDELPKSMKTSDYI